MKIDSVPNMQSSQLIYESGNTFSVRSQQPARVYLFQGDNPGEWVCHFPMRSSLYTNVPVVWRPNRDEVPNVVSRLLMRICLGVKWVKEA